MARDQIDMTPIHSRDELVAWLAAGCKPKEKFRVGTEHEKFVFTIDGHRPVPYEGPRGIRALLEGMQLLLGWEPIMEGENIIGLADVTVGFPGMPGFAKNHDGDDSPLEARAIGATVDGVRFWSLYVPNGRGLDDPQRLHVGV